MTFAKAQQIAARVWLDPGMAGAAPDPIMENDIARILVRVGTRNMVGEQHVGCDGRNALGRYWDSKPSDKANGLLRCDSCGHEIDEWMPKPSTEESRAATTGS